jgi:tripartite-type tricarboxylate transporter receptor subunit TctC
MMKQAILTAVAVATALLGSAPLAGAQEANYPSRPIRLIAPEVVGSATDLLSRIVAQRLGEALGEPVNVVNKFGEAGLKEGMKSPPDGYTIIYGSAGTLALLPHIKKVPFDSLKDFTPVARFAISPTLLAVNPSLPVNTTKELIDLLEANPNKYRMSTAGAGTAGHFAGEMFIAMAGVKSQVVHYDGGGPAIAAIVDGDAQWTFAPIAGRLPHVRTGKLKAIATGGTSRLSVLPDVPTVAESGLPGYNAVGWGGIFVPNGTPQPIIDKLNATIVAFLARPDVKEQFAVQGSEAAGSTPAELAALLKQDYVHLGEVAKSIGLRVD